MLSGHIRPMSGSFGHLPAHYVRLASHNNGIAVKLGLRISRAMARGISSLCSGSSAAVGMTTHRELSANDPPAYAEVEWFQHRNFCGFRGDGFLRVSEECRRMGFLHGADFGHKALT